MPSRFGPTVLMVSAIGLLFITVASHGTLVAATDSGPGQRSSSPFVKSSPRSASATLDRTEGNADSVLTSNQDWVTLMQEGFEGEFPSPGWQLSGNNDDVTWAKRDCKAQTGVYGAWSHGGGASGSGWACGTAYPDGLDSYMVYGPFSLESATAAEVELSYWADTQLDADRMLILLSTDATEWNGWSLSGATQDWETNTLALDEADVPGGVLGQPQVWLALGLEADDSVGHEGVYFDDITLRAVGAALPTAQPSATAVPPPTPVETPVPGDWIALISEGFEGAFPGPGWRIDSTNDAVHWGKRDCQAASGSYSAWGHGGGATGANYSCGTDYPSNLDTWLIYGPMSFADVAAAELELSVFADLEENADPFRFMVSIDAETYYGWVLNRSTVGWYSDVFDLAEASVPGGILGQPEVWLALIFTSNESVAYPGVHVDDIELRVKRSGPTSTPAPGTPSSTYLPLVSNGSTRP